MPRRTNTQEQESSKTREDCRKDLAREHNITTKTSKAEANNISH